MFMLHIRPRFQDRVLRVRKKERPCPAQSGLFICSISDKLLYMTSLLYPLRVTQLHSPSALHNGSPPPRSMIFTTLGRSICILTLWSSHPCPTVHLYIQTYLQYINQLPQHTLPWPFVINNRTVYTRLSMYLSLLREVAKVKIFTGKTTANRGKSNIL